MGQNASQNKLSGGIITDMESIKKHFTGAAAYRPMLAGIIALYGVIALGNATRWSVWFDEAFSAYLMRFNLTEMTAYTATDVHPPLYYWVLKGWVELFGTSDLAFRSLSVVAGAVAIWLMFMLVKRLFGSPRLALTASFFMAISPLVVRFGDEARMYTFALMIVLGATYALVRASEKRAGKRWWVLYGVLIAAGMLTHYFTALAWLAHWMWRFGEKRAGRMKRFWTKEWIFTHIGAVMVFAWWLPTAFKQFTVVQKEGFWIPPLGAYTPVDYVSDTFLYQLYGEVSGWWFVVFLLAVAASMYGLRRGYPLLKKHSPAGARLLLVMSIAPAVFLALVSLPPLSSAFINRYVLYAQVFGVVLVGLSLVAAHTKRPTKPGKLAIGVVVATLLIGIGNVYYYGNYNKNLHTSGRAKETVQLIKEAGTSGQPIIASSPWTYYDAVFYSSAAHPVYFLESSADGYPYGSLYMLRDSDTGKIKDLAAFTATHRYVWYFDTRIEGEVVPPVATWKRLKSIGVYDPIEHHTKYRASLFDTQP